MIIVENYRVVDKANWITVSETYIDVRCMGTDWRVLRDQNGIRLNGSRS